MEVVDGILDELGRESHGKVGHSRQAMISNCFENPLASVKTSGIDLCESRAHRVIL